MRLLFSLLLGTMPALACDCRQMTVCELMQQPILFVGEVINGGITSIREDPWYSTAEHVRFRVLETFRGLPRGTKTVDVKLFPPNGMCAPIPYQLGGKYLVVPSLQDGALTASGCIPYRDVESQAGDVQQVRQYFQAQLPINVQGEVSVSGNGKPLQHARIVASRGGKEFSTLSNVDGKYRLDLPAEGEYTLQASLSPYQPGSKVRFTIANKGCAVEYLSLRINNSISGKVLDRSNQVLKDARVGLIDLDRPSDGPGLDASFYSTFVGRTNGIFEFENVPIGHYLLVFNPIGDPSSAAYKLPFENTYYPGGSNRSEARQIDISSSDIHLTGMNLIAGDPVRFRQVRVRVHFEGGEPMKTAMVHGFGLPRAQNDLYWNIAQIASKEGELEFPAPTNRELKIEIRDWYGRPLNAAYAATFPPGTSPIFQDFVVKP
jgi:Carboxypeptidase regulatory-like domain